MENEYPEDFTTLEKIALVMACAIVLMLVVPLQFYGVGRMNLIALTNIAVLALCSIIDPGWAFQRMEERRGTIVACLFTAWSGSTIIGTFGALAVALLAVL